MIDTTNKKYEWIESMTDGWATLLDEYYKELLSFSIDGEFEEVEDFRIDNNIPKEDFYSTLIEDYRYHAYTLDIEKEIAYIAKYIYNNHKKAREIIDNYKNSREYRVFTDDSYFKDVHHIKKYKPAKCLYDNQIISPYIKYIYIVSVGTGEYTDYFGEYE